MTPNGTNAHILNGVLYIGLLVGPVLKRSGTSFQ